MASRFQFPFRPIRGNAPGFNSSLGSSAIYALEATSAREYQFPTSRALRVTSKAADDFSIILGTSTMAPSTATGMTVLGGAVEVFTVDADVTHVGIASSTDVTVNFTLGTGF